MKDVIQTVGGYAGIISLLGVVVLAMLCFSQARDLRRLRVWAGGAPERDAEVREVSELVAEERSQELRVLAEREERRLERSGMIEGSFWDRLGRTGRILAARHGDQILKIWDGAAAVRTIPARRAGLR